MPNSPLLGIPQIASNQNNKETTINDAFSIIERSLNARLTVSLAAGDVTLTSTEFQRSQVFHTTGALAIQTLTVPNQQRFFAVYNPGTYNVLVRAGTSSTVTVAPLSYVIMFAGGDNTLLKVADSAAAATSPTFLGQTDTPATFTGMAGRIPRVNVGETALELFQLLLNMSNLQDVDAYTNGYYARVKSDGSGIEWVAANPGGETDFTNLNDTPANFTGSGLHLVRVNTGETALEFVDPAGLLSFLQLAGTPSSYSGQESKIVAVNASADGLEFVPFPSLGSYSTRSISNDNPGFELGYLLPWDMDAAFAPAVTVVDEFNLVEANEGGFFVAVATTDFDDVTFAAIFDLTAAATNSELDNAATVTLPYAWAKLENGDTLGEVTLYAETASGTVLGSINATGLDGALDTWNTAAIQLDLPTGTRRIRITVRTYNGTMSDMTFGWDNLIPVLTVLEPLAFTALPDTPADYVGAANQFVRVNTGESSLEFVTLSLTHVGGFPSSYAGHAGKIVVVNPGENGVVFADAPEGLPDMDTFDGRLLRVATGGEAAEWVTFLSLLPDTTDNEGKHLALSEDGTALEWVDPPEAASTDTAFEIVTISAPASLAQGNRNRLIEVALASPGAITIPANATEVIEVGSMFTITNVTTVAMSLVAAAGVTLNGVEELSVAINTQWTGVTLYKRATDAWVVQGSFEVEV